MNPKTRNIFAWIITILLAAAFGMAGAYKLMGSEEMIQNFERWGLPTFTMYIVGILELLCVIGLFIPKTRMLAAYGIIVLMTGAAAIHLMNNEFSSVGTNLLLGGAAFGLAYLRRKTVVV